MSAKWRAWTATGVAIIAICISIAFYNKITTNAADKKQPSKFPKPCGVAMLKGRRRQVMRQLGQAPIEM